MTEGQVAPDAMARFRFSEAAQVIVFIVGGLYALGLLIVNVDLGLYGIVALELARPEYVMAGALWVVVVLAPVVASVWGLLNAWDFVKQRSFKGLLVAVVVIVVGGFVTPVAMMQVFSSPTEGERLTLGARHLLLIVVSTVAAFAVIPHLIYGRRAFSISGDSRFRVLSIVVSIVGVVLGLVFSGALVIWFYAAYAFPDMNRAFGGGRKPVVQIALRQQASSSWKFTGMPISADGASVGPVLLVLERSDAVVVSPISAPDQPWYRPRRHPSTTAIARELIAVVHYQSQLRYPL